MAKPDFLNRTARVLGIMSGTSLDGADYALCRIGPAGVRLLEFWQAPFSVALRNRLLQAAEGQATSHEVGKLHHDLGRFYARHAAGPARRHKPRLVGLHGQTIFHHPHASHPATFQLGETAYLAEALRIPVVGNFRAADLAAGGQGAPLATAFHVRQFARRGAHVCMHNLGGISNVTSIDWRRGQTPRLLSFDTGPGNMLVDLAARHYSKGRRSMDRQGRRAAHGKVESALLNRWLRHPFFRQAPPKSTGREMFGARFFETILPEMKTSGLDGDDALSTLTQFTVDSLVLNYRLHLPNMPGRVILAGGGAANPELVRRIREGLQTLHPRMEIVTSLEFGWPWQSVEPAAFAWLAWLRMQGEPGNYPQTTGANRRVLLGQVTEP